MIKIQVPCLFIGGELCGSRIPTPSDKSIPDYIKGVSETHGEYFYHKDLDKADHDLLLEKHRV